LCVSCLLTFFLLKRQPPPRHSSGSSTWAEHPATRLVDPTCSLPNAEPSKTHHHHQCKDTSPWAMPPRCCFALE
jgi:hypothetical protein